MPVALSQIYWWFPVDAVSPLDLSADLLELSLDQDAWISATYEASPPAGIVSSAAMITPVPTGYTRFWWRALAGPAQQLPLIYGDQYVHGRLTDTPEIPYFAWVVTVPND